MKDVVRLELWLSIDYNLPGRRETLIHALNEAERAILERFNDCTNEVEQVKNFADKRITVNIPDNW
jgi:hypothetical protein